MSAIGAQRGLNPPVTSCSAAIKAARNSNRLLPPRRLIRHRPSGRSNFRICSISPGRSSTQWRFRQEKTASKLASAKGRAAKSWTIKGLPACLAKAAAGSLCSIVPILPSGARCVKRRPSCAPRSRHRSKSRRIKSTRSARRNAASSFRNAKFA